ncbi:MAG: hypothetical protein HY043_04360, partial [Verrucomicrobia bacterium]|nr:hypothetical protein [Verrucomicrobiota bacterium]
MSSKLFPLASSRARLMLAFALIVSNRPPVFAADAEPMRGPFLSATIMRAKDKAAAMKGLAVTLGADKKSYVVYDLDTLRLAVAWTGEFLEFGNTLTKIEWPPPPAVKGSVAFETAMGPGWADKSGSLDDPRVRQQGPLPKDWAHYEGLYQHGDNVVLKYTVGGVGVLELPGLEIVNGRPAFTRTLQFAKRVESFTMKVADLAQPGIFVRAGEDLVVRDNAGKNVMVVGLSDRNTGHWSLDNEHLSLHLNKVKANKPLRLAFMRAEDWEAAGKPDLAKLGQLESDLRSLTHGGPAHWTEAITTQGKLGTEDGPYQVDTITEPFPNPYGTRTFWGGFDFLPDGRAVICAFHGDVWIVSGLDGKLDKLTWKRFATGLFQPLGVKVQKGEIYVAGRDQITRLKDINGDGEADFYENFNNDTVVTPNYHEFVLDLHTDSKGNFYYAKGAPWEPAVTSPHQGCLF